MKKTNEITNEKVLSWARRVEAQRAKKAILDATKESKAFEAIKKTSSTEECYRQHKKRHKNATK